MDPHQALLMQLFQLMQQGNAAGDDEGYIVAEEEDHLDNFAKLDPHDGLAVTIGTELALDVARKMCALHEAAPMLPPELLLDIAERGINPPESQIHENNFCRCDVKEYESQFDEGEENEDDEEANEDDEAVDTLQFSRPERSCASEAELLLRSQSELRENFIA